MQELLRLWSECEASPCPRLKRCQVFRQKAYNQGFETQEIDDFLEFVKNSKWAEEQVA